MEKMLREKGHVTNRDLRRALAISRQGVWKQVRPLVESGELAIEGVGRGVRYVAGPGFVRDGGVVRGDVLDQWGTPNGFWAALVKNAPRVGYVSVRRASRGTHRKEHGLALVHDLRFQSFVVLDFEGVESVSDTFAEAVLFGEYGSFQTIAINTAPKVRLALDRAVRNKSLRLLSDTTY